MRDGEKMTDEEIQKMGRLMTKFSMQGNLDQNLSLVFITLTAGLISVAKKKSNLAVKFVNIIDAFAKIISISDFSEACEIDTMVNKKR